MSEKKEDKLYTFDMLMKIVDTAKKTGVYDSYSEIEFEYQDIIKRAKNFHKKVEKIYNDLIKEGLIEEDEQKG